MHFAYCPHRWGRMFLDNEWETNASVALGDILHQTVHDPFKDECRGKKKIVRAMPLYSDRYDLHGVADCIEFNENSQGAFIRELNKYCTISVIEYKNGKPSDDGIKYSDKLQLAAQMICVEEMFGCMPLGYVYYGKTKRRVGINDYENAKTELLSIIEKIDYYKKIDEIPLAEKNNKCNGCSFYDKCLPKFRCKNNVKDMILTAEN